MLEPVGTTCYLHGYYNRFTDWQIFPNDGTITECANLCLRKPRCTGFQVENDDSFSQRAVVSSSLSTYCILFFDGACDSEHARGIYTTPDSLHVVTYARLFPSPPAPAVPPRLPPPDTRRRWTTPMLVSLIVLVSVVMTVGTTLAVSRAMKHKHDNYTSMVEMADADTGAVTRMTLEAMIERTLLKLDTKKDGSSPSGGAAGVLPAATSRFVEEKRRLIHGQPSDAALGINHFMRVSDDVVRAGMSKGVHAIVAEFERAGTDEDREVCHATCATTHAPLMISNRLKPTPLSTLSSAHVSTPHGTCTRYLYLCADLDVARIARCCCCSAWTMSFGSAPAPLPKSSPTRIARATATSTGTSAAIVECRRARG